MKWVVPILDKETGKARKLLECAKFDFKTNQPNIFPSKFLKFISIYITGVPFPPLDCGAYFKIYLNHVVRVDFGVFVSFAKYIMNNQHS